MKLDLKISILRKEYDRFKENIYDSINGVFSAII